MLLIHLAGQASGKRRDDGTAELSARSHGELMPATAASLPLSQPLVGKSQPACRINGAASFVRFFPAHLCLPSEPVRIVDVHLALQRDAKVTGMTDIEDRFVCQACGEREDNVGPVSSRSHGDLMKYAADRPYSDPDKAARRLMQHAHVFEPVQDGRIYIEHLNGAVPVRRQGDAG